MIDDEARELVERLNNGSDDWQTSMALRAEAAAFIEATIITDEKPVAWLHPAHVTQLLRGNSAYDVPVWATRADAVRFGNPGADHTALFLHPDPKVKELREALATLVDKLDAVHADERLRAVWTVSQMHIGAYAGPTYTDELAAARAALTGGKEMG